jgi:hypothetical protein
VCSHAGEQQTYCALVALRDGEASLVQATDCRRSMASLSAPTSVWFLLVFLCRVDPLASGHVFLVHGQACVKTQARQQCSFTGGGTPPAKMFMIDVKDLMQADWRVGIISTATPMQAAAPALLYCCQCCLLRCSS